MSNQARKDGVKDAGKKRRDYLWRKAGAATVALLTGGLALSIVISLVYTRLHPNPSLLAHLNIQTSVASFVVYTLIVAIAALRCVRSVKYTKSIPFVPPVAEHLAALPAEAILVRGSDEPAALPEELLRAAQARKEAPELTSESAPGASLTGPEGP